MTFVRRSLVALIACAAVSGAACGTPPDKEMQQAQGAIDAARAAGADDYAHEELVGAEDALKRAHDAVADRDYRLALNYALDSREQAKAAAKAAADHKAQARTEADHALASATAALADVHARLDAAEAARVPPRVLARPRKDITAADQVVQKASAAFEQGDYLAVKSLVSGKAAALREIARELETATGATGRRRR